MFPFQLRRRRLAFSVALPFLFATVAAGAETATPATRPTTATTKAKPAATAAAKPVAAAPATTPAATTTVADVAIAPVQGNAAKVLAAPVAPAMPKPAAVAEADAAATRIVDRLLGEIARTEGAPRRLSLAEAVQLAVQNNPGIRAQAEIPNSAAWQPYGATGPFDPKFRASAVASSTTAPSGSALASGKTIFKEDAVRTNASISKLLRSGGLVDLTWGSQIVDTNSVFYTINPRYDNRLVLSLRQPLLRNFWASEQNTTVLVARSQAEESLAQFEADLSNFVSRVIDAYWSYEQAAAELEVSRRSVALARELVRDAEAKVNVGLLAPVAVKEAQADAAAREETALVVENALVVAGRELQHEVMSGASEDKAPEQVLPVEEHLVTPVELDRAESLKTAVECRAEIRRATFALGRRRTEEKYARNRRLPQLDIVGHYGLLGLAGGHTYDENGVLRDTPYYGDYSDSFDDLVTNDFNDYAVGLELEVPFGNATAKADLAEAEIEVRRASRDLEQTVSTVALDVDRAIADVASAAKRVTASRIARELAEENLRNQTRRFELGAVTTKDVLDFQEKLAQAQASEVRSITDHAKSVTRLRVAEGTLLARFGIEIQNPAAPGIPWWYKF